MKILLGSALTVCICSVCLADDLGIRGALEVGANYINFGQTLAGGSYTPAPGTGIFQVTGVGSGSVFATAGVTTGEQGTIQSLDEGTGPVTLPSAFMTFTGAGGSAVPLTATDIPAGSVGPFLLMDTVQGAEASFEVLGYIGSNTSDTFTAEFAIGFPGYTVARLFTSLPLDEQFCANIDASGTPTLCDPFQTATATPEPRYAFLIAAGLLAAVMVNKRRIIQRKSRRPL